MGAPHHLLTAKIPDIEPDLAVFWRPALNLDLLVLNDAGRFRLSRVARLSLDEIAKERCLADRLVADTRSFNSFSGRSDSLCCARTKLR